MGIVQENLSMSSNVYTCMKCIVSSTPILSDLYKFI